MIKVENGVCEIKTSEGVPGMMTDLSYVRRYACGPYRLSA